MRVAVARLLVINAHVFIWEFISEIEKVGKIAQIRLMNDLANPDAMVVGHRKSRPVAACRTAARSTEHHNRRAVVPLGAQLIAQGRFECIGRNVCSTRSRSNDRLRRLHDDVKIRQSRAAGNVQTR